MPLTAPILLATAFLLLMLLLNGLFIFHLVNSFLSDPRFGCIFRLFAVVINVALVASAFLFTSSALAYLLYFVLLFMDFLMFYRDSPLSSTFAALACIVHIMAIRSMVCGIFAFVTGQSVYALSSDPFPLIGLLGVSFLFINLTTLIIIYFIPSQKLRIISQHRDQLLFMNAWMTMFSLFLLFSARLYSTPAPPLVAQNLLVAPLLVLSAVYLALFFIIRTGDILGYREQNEELKEQVENVRRYQASMIGEALITFECDFTADRMLRGFEDCLQELKETTGSSSYDALGRWLASQRIHPEDRENFLSKADSKRCIQAFRQGHHEIVAEYRRLSAEGEYRWVKSVTSLARDSKSRHIKGFTYVKDIEAEKQTELQLRHRAERDALTGLYNKAMTQETIAELLSGGNDGVLFIIDVDDFKNINDGLGHAYGDVVLCELADKLKKLFREEDVVGRIGGDEFIAFLKGSAEQPMIERRAGEILHAFSNRYTGEHGQEYAVTGSLGIAVCPRDGNTFEALYRNSDIALYAAKDKGKNTYCFYDGREFSGYSSNRTAIDSRSGLQQKSFKENRAEYVFKILYDAENEDNAICSVLDIISRHFHFDRGYVASMSANGESLTKTFELCGDDYPPPPGEPAVIPVDCLPTTMAAFERIGMMVAGNLTELTPGERANLEARGVKSMFQFGVFYHSRLTGFVGFENCREEEMLTAQQMDDLLTICNILATFLIKRQATANSAKLLDALTTVMDHLDSYTYVINRDTYEVLFMNRAAATLVGDPRMRDTLGTGERCYNVFHGLDAPCAECPAAQLTDSSDSRCTMEVYNQKFGILARVVSSPIQWVDGQAACLLHCTDIGKYKNG